MGRDPFGPSSNARYRPGLVSQGVAAELVAARWKLDRDELDAYAARSHRRAAEAAAAAASTSEIVPVSTPDGGMSSATRRSAPTTTVEGLAQLKPAFADAAMAARFPEIELARHRRQLLADHRRRRRAADHEREDGAASSGCKPRARFVAFAVCGDDPLLMLTAPIPATQPLIARAGLGLGDIDHFEVNEAFASVPLAWRARLGGATRSASIRAAARSRSAIRSARPAPV